LIKASAAGAAASAVGAKEVWFTEREALCRLTFHDGRLP